MSNYISFKTEDEFRAAVMNVFLQAKDSESKGSDGLLDPDQRLTQHQAAKFLNCSISTIIRWRKQNLLPYFQVGRRFLYSKKQLIELAQRNC